MTRKEYAKNYGLNKLTAKFPWFMLLIVSPFYLVFFPVLWFISEFGEMVKAYKYFIKNDIGALITYIKLDKG